MAVETFQFTADVNLNGKRVRNGYSGELQTLNGRFGTSSEFIGDGDDVLNGTTGNDAVIWNVSGIAGLQSFSGIKTFNLGAGNDVLDLTPAPFQVGSVEYGIDVVVDGGTGADVIFAGNGNDELRGGDNNDYINGGVGGDIIVGGAGNDRLFGLSGDDVIYGDGGELGDNTATDGADVLVGGAGNDILFGDNGSPSGADRFVFNPNSGQDTIANFDQGSDKIDVRGYGFTSIDNMTIVYDDASFPNEATVYFADNTFGSDYVAVPVNPGDFLGSSDFIFVSVN